MSKRLATLILIILVVGTCTLLAPSARAEDQDDKWAPLRFLLGTWEGGSESSVVTHTYEFVVQDKFIQSRTRSEAEAPDGDGPAEVHEDVGYFSYDPDRELIVFRQFLSEGYVNTYTLAPKENPGDSLVFTSESTEGAGGMQARLTIRAPAPDSYEMLLDLASPGKEFFTCQRISMKRVQSE